VLLGPHAHAPVRPKVQHYGEDSISEDPVGNKWGPQVTPVVMFIQHCNDTTDWVDKIDKINFLDFLIKHDADLKTGNPADRAKDKGCDVMRQKLEAHEDCGCHNDLTTHFKKHFKKWGESIDHHTRVFIGPRHIFNVNFFLSLPLGFIIGVVAGVLTYLAWMQKLSNCESKRASVANGSETFAVMALREVEDLDRHESKMGLLEHGDVPVQKEIPCRGAWEMAALAHCSFSEKWFQFSMCILAVFAHIIFPLHICMSTVTPGVFLVWYGFAMLIPYILTLRRFGSRTRFTNIARAVMISHGPPHYVHALGIARPIISFLFSTWVAARKDAKYMDTAASYVHPCLKPWFVMRKMALENLPPPAWLEGARNLRAEFSVDPYHLMGEESLSLSFSSTPTIQTRSIFFNFEAITGVLTVLWCILASCCLIRKACAGKGNEQSKEVQDLAQKIQNQLTREGALEPMKPEDVENHHQFPVEGGELAHEGALEPKKLGRVGSWCFSRIVRYFLSCVLYSVASDSHFIRIIDDDGRLVRDVRPLKLSLRMHALTWFLDMLAALYHVHNLYFNACHAFGGVALSMLTWSLTLQLLRSHPCKLCTEMKNNKSVKHGVPTDEYFEALGWEKGVGAFFNLQFTAYTIRFSMMTADSVIFGFFGLFLSIWGFAHYMFSRGVLKSKYKD